MRYCPNDRCPRHLRAEELGDDVTACPFCLSPLVVAPRAPGADAKAEPAVKVIGTFPADSHPEIVYPAGIVAGSKNPDTAAFVAYLQGAKAQAIFREQGFTVLMPPAN
jgi:ABC-type molybdate transport system substrate-binding protein